MLPSSGLIGTTGIFVQFRGCIGIVVGAIVVVFVGAIVGDIVVILFCEYATRKGNVKEIVNEGR